MASDQRWWRAAELLSSAHIGNQFRSAVAGLHSQKLANRQWSDDAIDRDACVALKVSDACGGVVAEDAVNPTTVKAERAESLLEVGDIIAPKHRRPPKQRSITEPIPGFDEGLPRLRPTDAVHAQPPPMLECLDGGAGRRGKPAWGIFDRAEAQGSKPRAQIGDRVSSGSLVEGEHPLGF
jgi:hypothetical protein